MRRKRSIPDYDGMGAVAWVVVLTATAIASVLTFFFGWRAGAIFAGVFFVLWLAAGRGERI